MAQFRYSARDAQGKLQQGTMEATDERSAADSLLRRGIMPLTLEPVSETKGLALPNFFARRVKLEKLIIFTRQMYSLTKAGIPLLKAIDGLAENSQNKRLRVVLRDIVEQLERGRSLSSAMGAHKRVFPRLMVAIVHVGENTGQLEESFLQLATYLEQEQDTRKRIKAASRYPSFVLIALTIAIFLLNLFVIPTFANMFQRFNVELPLSTRILIETSTFFENYWALILLALFAIVVGIRRYIADGQGRVQWDYLKLRIPIVGSIISRSMMARFARSFSVMLSAGVPLTQALSLVAEAVDNAWMEKRVLDMRRGIERGESLTRVSRQSALFTALVLQMIAVGEETGRVDDLLEEVADYYEREVDYDLKTLTARIEPILVAVVAGLVLIVAQGIFTPMWDMMRAYQGG
ncbi:type II secretion system F family protein [Idiomarina xiamenensis]|uniref:Type II secretory pathway n=1 Tax=Idiomarina xiamenensis 10-D-4 TaxID=740709 RepID=K2KSK6_9GAMM|nr:type II secretion system F family protein [Idiomarina xiamenensis]EKE85404.1 Type II secretory pathway [Idiomarina xiamenensis 10-D-4]